MLSLYPPGFDRERLPTAPSQPALVAEGRERSRGLTAEQQAERAAARAEATEARSREKEAKERERIAEREAR